MTDNEADLDAEIQNFVDAAESLAYDPGFSAGEQWAKAQTEDHLRWWVGNSRGHSNATWALPKGVAVPENYLVEVEATAARDRMGTGGMWALGFLDGAKSILHAIDPSY